MPLPPELTGKDESELRLILPKLSPSKVTGRILTTLQAWADDYALSRKLKSKLRGKLTDADKAWLSRREFIFYQEVQKIMQANPRYLYNRLTRIYLPYYRNALYYLPEVIRAREELLMHDLPDEPAKPIEKPSWTELALLEEKKELHRIKQTLHAVKLSKRFGLLTTAKMTGILPQAITAAASKLNTLTEEEYTQACLAEFYGKSIIIEVNDIEPGKIGTVCVEIPKEPSISEIPPPKKGWYR